MVTKEMIERAERVSNQMFPRMSLNRKIWVSVGVASVFAAATCASVWAWSNVIRSLG